MGPLLSRGPEAWHWSGSPGNHSPYPCDVIPSPPVDYCFFDIMATYKIVDHRVNLGPTAVTTDVDDYLDELQYCLDAGYRIKSFCRVPGLTNTTIAQDWTLNTPYQVILTKPRFKAEHDRYRLKLEKSILSPRTMHFDNNYGDNHLLNMIKKYASTGGRLVATCPVGHVASETTNRQYGVAGVELFFEVPHEKLSSASYIYHTIKIPGSYRVQLDQTQTIQTVVSDADFHGQLSAYLHQGWKLVDICMDTSALPEVFRARAGVRYMDTIWIFEKSRDHLEDCTPRYEGAIIEYLHKIKNCGHLELPVRDWRPVIAGMGELGWTLAAVVQTPVLVQRSFRCYTIKMLFIFQRRVSRVKSSQPCVQIHPIHNSPSLKLNSHTPASEDDPPTPDSDHDREGNAGISPYLDSGSEPVGTPDEVCSDSTEPLLDNLSEISSTTPRVYENSLKDPPQLPEYNGHVDLVPPTYDTHPLNREPVLLSPPLPASLPLSTSLSRAPPCYSETLSGSALTV